MFEVGEPASDPLQAIAEGGDIGPMQSALENGGAATSVAEIPSAAPVLAPGETAVALVDAKGQNRRLSLAAMILPTNDEFIGLDSINIRRSAGRTFYLYGYDAGTEANNELLNPGLLAVTARVSVAAISIRQSTFTEVLSVMTII